MNDHPQLATQRSLCKNSSRILRRRRSLAPNHEDTPGKWQIGTEIPFTQCSTSYYREPSLSLYIQRKSRDTQTLLLSPNTIIPQKPPETYTTDDDITSQTPRPLHLKSEDTNLRCVSRRLPHIRDICVDDPIISYVSSINSVLRPHIAVPQRPATKATWKYNAEAVEHDIH